MTPEVPPAMLDRAQTAASGARPVLELRSVVTALRTGQ